MKKLEKPGIASRIFGVLFGVAFGVTAGPFAAVIRMFLGKERKVVEKILYRSGNWAGIPLMGIYLSIPIVMGLGVIWGGVRGIYYGAKWGVNGIKDFAFLLKEISPREQEYLETWAVKWNHNRPAIKLSDGEQTENLKKLIKKIEENLDAFYSPEAQHRAKEYLFNSYFDLYEKYINQGKYELALETAEKFSKTFWGIGDQEADTLAETLKKIAKAHIAIEAAAKDCRVGSINRAEKRVDKAALSQVPTWMVENKVWHDKLFEIMKKLLDKKANLYSQIHPPSVENTFADSTIIQVQPPSSVPPEVQPPSTPYLLFSAFDKVKQFFSQLTTNNSAVDDTSKQNSSELDIKSVTNKRI